MEIIFTSKNIKITDHLRDYAEKKLRSSCRLIPEVLRKEEEDREKSEEHVDRVVLELELEKVTGEEKGKIFRAEAQLKIPGIKIRAENVSETTKAAIDKVRDELERQIKENKEKIKTKRIKGGQKAKKLRG